eukprot:TRINITY_DN3439_c0_g1_i2.p1 TRINITY_DN3439_c0_g1~~TRINITY_DN3439_c0_g1_i2.p1  ORF type:complete len:329 (+),score=63.49 TRINITY_DN3439_c0_g1_i2:366-1352(+)
MRRTRVRVSGVRTQNDISTMVYKKLVNKGASSKSVLLSFVSDSEKSYRNLKRATKSFKSVFHVNLPPFSDLSDWYDGISIQSLANDTFRLLDNHNVHHFDIVASGVRCPVAWAMKHLDPERVTSVTNFDPILPFPKDYSLKQVLEDDVDQGLFDAIRYLSTKIPKIMNFVFFSLEYNFFDFVDNMLDPILDPGNISYSVFNVSNQYKKLPFSKYFRAIYMTSIDWGFDPFEHESTIIVSNNTQNKRKYENLGEKVKVIVEETGYSKATFSRTLRKNVEFRKTSVSEKIDFDKRLSANYFLRDLRERRKKYSSNKKKNNDEITSDSKSK